MRTGSLVIWLRTLSIGFATLVLLMATAKVTLQGQSGQAMDDRSFGLWVVATLILSPISWIHYMVLLVIPFTQIAIAANRGECSGSVVWAAIASYFLIAIAIGLRKAMPHLNTSVIFHPIMEVGFLSLLLAYIAVYRFTAEGAQSSQPQHVIQELMEAS